MVLQSMAVQPVEEAHVPIYATPALLDGRRIRAQLIILSV
jgi:hypothetical protein